MQRRLSFYMSGFIPAAPQVFLCGFRAAFHCGQVLISYCSVCYFPSRTVEWHHPVCISVFCFCFFSLNGKVRWLESVFWSICFSCNVWTYFKYWCLFPLWCKLWQLTESVRNLDFIFVGVQGVIVRKVRRVYLLCFLTDTNELHSHAVCRDAVNMCTLCAVHACRVVSSADMFTEGPHISTRLCAKPVKHPAIRVSTCVHTYTHIAYIHCVRRGSGKKKKKKATEMYLATCYILH